jgi:dihydrofolate reductase
VPRADALDEVDELKRGSSSGDILVFGSRTMWNGLLRAGLVDELHVLVGPALLGGGTPIYSGPSRVLLRLLEGRVLEASQLVLLRYDATNSAQT